MKLAGCLLALLGALRGGFGLQVTLSEPGVMYTSNLLLEGSPRSIPLVTNKTYSISCEGDWYRYGTQVTMSPVAEGESGVYVSGENLQLQLLSDNEQQTGEYMCTASDGEEFVINITIGNPVLIPNREMIGLDQDLTRVPFPSIPIFGSGNPQPSPSNYTWLFNGRVIFENGAMVEPIPSGLVQVRFDSVILEREITSEIEGVYESFVRTTAGETNVSVTVRIEAKPVPVMSVVSPEAYATDSVANGESLTLNCSDAVGVPVPVFKWSVNGTAVTETSGVYAISSGNGGRESYLTIVAIDYSHNGVEVKCEACSTVEGSAVTKGTALSITVRDPPPPPSNVTVQALSSCRVELSWILPPAPPTDPLTLETEFFQIEARAGGEGGAWSVVMEHVDNMTTTTSVEVQDAAGMNDVLYDFRVRSGNRRGGVSPESTQSNESLSLFSDPLPAVTTLQVSPVLTSPHSLSVTWINPTTNCYLFVSHTVSCRQGNQQPFINTTIGSRSSTTVTGLVPDSTYSCHVNSTVSDRGGGEFPNVTVSTVANNYTLPNYPAEPEQPVAMKTGSSSTNITVIFSLPPDHGAISHYQVLVVRLRSEEDLPETNPDDDYGSDFDFPSESSVNDPTIDKPLQGPYIAAEVTAERFNGQFTIGAGPSNPNSNSPSNGPLLSGTKYSCFLRSFPHSSFLGQKQVYIFSSSPYMAVQETGPDESTGDSASSLTPMVAGIIAAGVVVVVILLTATMLLVICFCYQRRRKRYRLDRNSASLSSSSKDSLELPRVSTPDLCRKEPARELKQLDFLEEDLTEYIPSGSFPVMMFREHVEKFDENRQLLFQLEFDWVQANAPSLPAEASSLPVNDDKNRYSNIKAFDHSRVVLSSVGEVEGSDYINANFIPGFKRSKEYISTQGPLEQTVSEFWRMVWEQNSATIVMLTNLVEVGKVKCAQYWPSAAVGSIPYGDIEVTLGDVVELRDYTVRNFTITHMPTKETHTVLQFHYTKWPDYGTPKLAAPLLNFLRAVHASNPPGVGPIVVHCSAGVGRSGTVICIDYCLAQLRTDSVIDVRGFVSRMRENRNYMVQTETQYAFIHYAILEAITYGNTSFPLADFSHSYQQLQQKDSESGRTLLEAEFARLGTVKTMSKTSTFIQRVKQKGPTNRSIHYPGHASYSEGTNPHEYNAHYIDGYFTPKVFVVASGPEERNVIKFWQMVWEQDCSFLIMLTPLDAQYFAYWPTRKGEHETYGNIKVMVEEESMEHYFTTRVISIANTKVIGISQKITHYQFVGWTMQYLPPVPAFVAFVCEILEGVETLQRNQKALIHDTKSLGPAGIFCSLCYCIERLRVERMVDVFQTVQALQLQRPGTIQNMQEYAFIYDCVYEYIRTHLST